ncbi:hypothetical protein DRO26_00300 [Candidatus Bathyarchaeota archaeon]|nr:MAG: hypothetical protein DRO26_00300 [Candidatus Bathyarchaeota archaeon]
MQLSNILASRPSLRWDDPLLLALNILGGKQTPYRITVVDECCRVKGVISGRRILEVLLGKRGESIKTQKGIKGILREPVNLFLDEVHNIFPENVTPQTILQYIAENNIGYVFVVDQNGAFKGVVDEASILNKLKDKVFDIKVEDIMNRTIHTVLPEISLLEASTLMVNFHVRRLPVTINNTIMGIITITDILRHVLMKEKHLELLLHDVEVEDVLKEKVKEVMCSELVYVNPVDDAGEAVNKIINNDVSCLPVIVGKNSLAGIVCRVDLLVKIIKMKGIQTVLHLMR